MFVRELIGEENLGFGILRLGGNTPIVDNESCYFFCMTQKSLSAMSIFANIDWAKVEVRVVLDLEDVGEGQREEVSLPSMAVGCEGIE